MPEYLPRIVDNELALRLEAFGATLIVGPKWCGKTTTGEQQAKSILRMQDPDRREGYMATANTKPSLLLRGENPRLIDEWQVAPVLWDAVRTAVDQRQEEGLFILTGSTSVDNSKIMHSGTGRISRQAPQRDRTDRTAEDAAHEPVRVEGIQRQHFTESAVQ